MRFQSVIDRVPDVSAISHVRTYQLLTRYIYDARLTIYILTYAGELKRLKQVTEIMSCCPLCARDHYSMAAITLLDPDLDQ